LSNFWGQFKSGAVQGVELSLFCKASDELALAGVADVRDRVRPGRRRIYRVWLDFRAATI
jgi:hypothetical protein